MSRFIFLLVGALGFFACSHGKGLVATGKSDGAVADASTPDWAAEHGAEGTGGGVGGTGGGMGGTGGAVGGASGGMGGASGGGGIVEAGAAGGSFVGSCTAKTERAVGPDSVTEIVCTDYTSDSGSAASVQQACAQLSINPTTTTFSADHCSTLHSLGKCTINDTVVYDYSGAILTAATAAQKCTDLGGVWSNS